MPPKSNCKNLSVSFILPIYLLVTFFGLKIVMDEQDSGKGTVNISRNINLEHSPHCFNSTSFSIAKPVCAFSPGMLRSIDNNSYNFKIINFLPEEEQKKYFSSSIALYIYNRVLLQ